VKNDALNHNHADRKIGRRKAGSYGRPMEELKKTAHKAQRRNAREELYAFLQRNALTDEELKEIKDNERPD
jgi:hypothetical protein